MTPRRARSVERTTLSKLQFALRCPCVKGASHLGWSAQAMSPEDALMLMAMHETAGRGQHDLTFVVCHNEPGAAVASAQTMASHTQCHTCTLAPPACSQHLR